MLAEVSVLRGRHSRLEGEVERERGALQEVQLRQERLHRAVATLDTRIHQEKQLREATSREADASETQLLARLQVQLMNDKSHACFCQYRSVF